MNNLKTLLLYREIFDSNRPLDKPTIEDNKYFLSENNADEIVKYFESGLVLLEFVSPIEDPYNHQDILPNIIYSDGVYVWDAIIINWVRKYRVRLPAEFIDYFKGLSNIVVDKKVRSGKVIGFI
ncbi:hypothetical protein IC800_06255 [Acinetobacter seifertii]|uniref:hypothetical protein n=1 Tax=Acinetobacter seifertii TaxID=1530123 RepID=UPI00168CEECE|nr:hypothetical protein [Acinetobacter seifertii]QNW95837.1 hypothetical protein IC800_06255 [Acinetobacter seifertii]